MSQQTETIPLTAQVRTETGSGAAIREREEGRIPGILYGLDKPPVPISVTRSLVTGMTSAVTTGQGAKLRPSVPTA